MHTHTHIYIYISLSLSVFVTAQGFIGPGLTWPRNGDSIMSNDPKSALLSDLPAAMAIGEG